MMEVAKRKRRKTGRPTTASEDDLAIRCVQQCVEYLQPESLFRVTMSCRSLLIHLHDNQRAWRLSFRWNIVYQAHHAISDSFHTVSWREMTQRRWLAERQAGLLTRQFGSTTFKRMKRVCPVCCCFKVLSNTSNLRRHLSSKHKALSPGERRRALLLATKQARGCFKMKGML